MREKTGGRQKGTPNKINQQVRDRLSELDCDPLKSLVILAKEAHAQNNINLAANIYKDLMTYIAPKPKTIDSAEDRKPPEHLQITIIDAAEDFRHQKKLTQ